MPMMEKREHEEERQEQVMVVSGTTSPQTFIQEEEEVERETPTQIHSKQVDETIKEIPKDQDA